MYLKMQLSLLSLFIITYLSHCTSKQLPSFIKKCSLSAQNVGECVKARIHELKPRLANGIPELKIPPVEPLRIPKLEIHTGTGTNVAFNSTLSNLVVHGVKDVSISVLDFDFENKKIKITIKLPTLNAVGDNEVTGKVLLFQLSSKGRVLANISDVDADTEVNFKLTEKNGKKYLQIIHDGIVVKNTFSKAIIYFENLFPNKEINDRINLAINENVVELAKEVSPLVHDAAHLLITGILSPVFNDYSMDELFDK